MILLPLLVALNAAAAPAPAPDALKVLRTFRQGTADPGFTVIATPTDSSVNVWSLETGQQISHVDVPKVESTDPKDADEILIHSVRPDLKLILLSARHRSYNPAYKPEDLKDTEPQYKRAVHSVYLASLEDEKDVKKLVTFDGPCAYWGPVDYGCPGFDRPYWASILPGYPVLYVSGHKTFGDHLTGSRYVGTLTSYFDLTGKKLYENEIVEENFKLIKGVQKGYDSPLWADAVWVTQDAQSCSAMRAKKRVSFLQECTVDDNPATLLGDKLISSRYPAYKLWEAATGRLVAKLDAAPAQNWRVETWSEGNDARVVAALLRDYSGDAEIQLWDTASGKKLRTLSGPALKDITGLQLSPDGRRALLEKTYYKEGDRYDHADSLLVDLGLGDAPSAPAAPSVAKVDVDALPTASVKTDPDAFAVVIGVEKYRSAGVPVVDYAARDAKTVAAYLGVMGFDPKNVAVLTDADAGKVDFDKYFGKWLQNRTGPKSRVFVYYAGHGAPNPTTGAGYLMPYEADPSYLDESAYPVARLYAELGKLKTKDVTVVLDACFSGQGERSLIAKGTRPLVATQAVRGPEGVAVLAAASGSQISASDHEARHGLLTYHLLAGLHGGADANGDGKITAAEAFAYARPAVERSAKLQNVEQTPTVSGADSPAGARVWLTVKKP